MGYLSKSCDVAVVGELGVLVLVCLSFPPVFFLCKIASPAKAKIKDGKKSPTESLLLKSLIESLFFVFSL